MSTEILAPLPGKIINILSKIGEEVMDDQEVFVIEAMKMETLIYAPVAGKVKEVKVQVEDNIETDQILMIIE